MLFLLSFLVLFGAAVTALLLAVDSIYARTGVERRLEPAGGRRWSPESGDVVEPPVVGRTVLPQDVRSRLWLMLLLAVLVGVGLLALAV